MKREYRRNGHKFLISNDYDIITGKKYIYMKGVRFKCRHYSGNLKSQQPLSNPLKHLHKRRRD